MNAPSTKRSRRAARSFRDLVVWRLAHAFQELASSLDEVSRLLNAYVRAILASRS
jgi:hypothetical protein